MNTESSSSGTELLGQVLGRDRYTVDQLIGRGGFAYVYKGHDRDLKIDVAIKVPRPEIRDQEGFLERFEEEKKHLIQARRDGGVVAVRDAGTHEGVPFFVMDYMPGRNLRTVLEETPRQTPGQVLSWLRPIASALQTIHGLGIVHLDVKPTNILFDGDGHAVLSDFGIARLVDLPRLRGHGSLPGSPNYMAPESRRGDGTRQSDQYSLGVVVYQALTGQRPPPAESGVKAVAPPAQLVGGLPAGCSDAVLRALHLDQDQRFPTSAAFAMAFEQACRGAAPSAVHGPVVQSHEETQHVQVSTAGAGSFGGGWRWTALLALSLVACAVLGVLLLHAYEVKDLGALSRTPHYQPKPGRTLMPFSPEAAPANLGRIDDAWKAGGASRASQVLDQLEARVLVLGHAGDLGSVQLAKVKDDVLALRAELEARVYLEGKALRPAYERIREHLLAGAGISDPVRVRLAALQERVRRALEQREPVVDGIAFVKIPAGTYEVGTPPEEPRRVEKGGDLREGLLPDLAVRQVRVRGAYWISTTEVTREVYGAHMTTVPPSWAEGARVKDRAASDLSLDDAQRFCRKLSAEFPTYAFDLPAESEWEIACRAGERPRLGPFVIASPDQHKLAVARDGKDFNISIEPIERLVAKHAAYQQNAAGQLRKLGLEGPPLPVGLFLPNRLGMYDVHGNVAEWVLPDPRTRSRGSVVRGGHCSSQYGDLRAGARCRGEGKSHSYGFRIVARPAETLSGDR